MAGALVHTVDDKGEIHVHVLVRLLVVFFFPVLVVFILLAATERDTMQYGMLHFFIQYC